jgi:hypothetical protein
MPLKIGSGSNYFIELHLFQVCYVLVKLVKDRLGAGDLARLTVPHRLPFFTSMSAGRTL